MGNYFIQFSKDTFLFNSIIGFFIYWVPVSLCVFGYTLRTFNNYRHDLIQRRKSELKKVDYYSPTDTIGDIIGRAIVSVIPIANTWAATFDVAPKLFSKLFEFVGRIFDQPLVPEKKNR